MQAPFPADCIRGLKIPNLGTIVAGLRHLGLIYKYSRLLQNSCYFPSALLPIQFREECLAERNSQGKIGPLALHIYSRPVLICKQFRTPENP